MVKNISMNIIKENLYTPDCIRTNSGIYINVFEPTIDMINIEDIAHALSNQCRFTGHLREFFSIAQHSIECCVMAEEAHKLQALMHDASEAYLCDIATPIKRRLTNYEEIEHNLMLLIAERFEFDYPLTEDIKEIDKIQLHYEWNNFMLNENPNKFKYALNPRQAKERFLEYFYELKP